MIAFCNSVAIAAILVTNKNLSLDIELFQYIASYTDYLFLEGSYIYPYKSLDHNSHSELMLELTSNIPTS